MNVQDATNLSINEGEVRTIHNSAGAQLWGKLNYNTLYKGNSEQVTYSGNNLFDKSNAIENTILGWAAANDVVENGSLLVHEYMLVTEGDTFASNYGMCVFFFNNNNEYLGCLLSGGNTIGKQTGTYVRTFSVPSGYGITKMKVEYRHNQGGNPSDMTSVTDIMLNTGNRVLPYEPYTGGVPSPNPDYPQTIEVVTGEQTLSISGGTITGEFNINLGTTELCKIGSYQDYIYQGNDGWYIHKAINKVLFNGSESWSMFSGRNGTFYISKSDIILAPSIDVTPNVMSNYYEPKPFRSLYDMVVDYGVANHNAQHWIAIRNKNYSDVNSFKSWLDSHNTTVYYVLATPTETKITDTTLVNSLDAVHEWLTRYGYTYSVNGSLPIIIEQNSLT